jgi:hypothetical protein
MEGQQSAYEKQMMEEAQKQYLLVDADKLRSRDSPFLPRSLPHRLRKDV